MTVPYKIVILGGGISGLSAAFYVQKYAREQGIIVDITVIERSNRLGGRLHTKRRDGFLIETGPDAFLARKPAILQLASEIGLDTELVPTNPSAKTSYILHKGRMHPMPMGFILGIPTKLTPFIRTGLISPLGKARAALDLLLPARRGDSDESLGDFIERRLGREVLEHITEPLLAGIYAGDTRSLSLAATFPQFRKMEEKYRSLIIGMARGNGGAKTSHSSSVSRTGASSANSHSMFLSFRSGMSALIERLEQQLSSVRFVVGSEAVALSPSNTLTDRYVITTGDREQLFADGVICALPAYEAMRLLPQTEKIRRLADIHYVSVANISLAYRTADLNVKFERSGFLVPRKEGRRITACTWSSTKWKHVAPEGYTLLRAYIGRSGAQQWTSMTDTELIEAARQDLQDLIGLIGEPDWAEVSRCMSSMPQYPVGYTEMMRKVREELAGQMPGVILCGAGYGGVGIPDCIAGGKEAAGILIETIS